MQTQPWDVLNQYKGTFFKGEWPTISEMVRITITRYPQRNALTIFNPDRITYTYSQLGERTRAVATHLSSLGIQKGDRIAVSGKNSPEWAMAYLSVLEAGCIVVPIDNQLSNEDCAELIRRSGSRVAFADQEKFADLEKEKLDLLKLFSLTPGFGTCILDIKSAEGVTLEPSSEKDTAAILYTSGTTGVSKGVMLSNRNIVSDVFLSQAHMKLYHTDVFYALLPIHHSYTMTAVFLETLSVGAEVVFGQKLVFTQIKKDFEQGGITMFLGVPLLFNKIIAGLLKGVKEKGPLVYGLIRALMSLSGLIKRVFKVNPGKKMFGFLLKKVSLHTNRICISGGGPLPASTFRLFNQLGIDFVQGYGLTETAPIINLNPVEHFKLTSVGKLVPQVDMIILDPDENGNGEIAVKGPMIMQGYYENEEATTAAFTENGYFKTGDVGHLDKEDYLYLTGRKGSLIVTEGGKNVYPEEIEDAFQLYTEIGQVLVKGYIKDAAKKSEGIEALIYPEPEWTREQSAEALRSRMDEIIKEVNKTQMIYKHIEQLHILDHEMEMTSTKKIKRSKICKDFDAQR